MITMTTRLSLGAGLAQNMRNEPDALDDDDVNLRCF